MKFERLGEFSLLWGESLRWDDQRQRLYFVDCAAQTLQWLDDLDGHSTPETLSLPSMPTGVVLAEDSRLVACLDDGLHVIDVDERSVELLAPYPSEIGGRANDAAADLNGNLVTGSLNLLPGPGSYWWFSASEGWRQLDDGISNANGPVVLSQGTDSTLIFADTLAERIFSFPYNGKRGTVGPRNVLAQTTDMGGKPDGACADADGGIWSCTLGAGKLVRYVDGNADTTLDTGVELPSDVTFGGPDLDRMFVVSIAMSIGDVEVKSPDAGKLLVLDGSGFRGRPEPRFRL